MTPILSSREKSKLTPKSITEGFAFLGDGAPGMCYSFSKAAFAAELTGDWERVPRPGYPHRIYVDPISKHFLVMRPTYSGSYQGVPLAAKRVR